MLHPRLNGLPARAVGPHASVLEARGFRARLLGLAFARRHQLPSGHALLLPRCSSVHTFGMRFQIDVAFADAEGTVLRVIRDVPPRRVARCPRASFALEAHAGELSRFLAGGRGAGARLADGVIG
jgi:uncharacterized membrane protein (UPF0127 family)